MNRLIINLNTDIQKNRIQTVAKNRLLWGPTFSSGLGMLLMLGFFTFIFGSTIFLVEKTGGGVLAHDTGNNLATTLGITSLEEKDDGNPVEVILYKDPFEFIEIEARAACVFDVVTGEVLYEKNKDKVLPLASITKVMTALAARYVLNEDDLVYIRPEDVSLEGSSGFLTGEEWRFKDLLDFTLMTSSNDGASAIAATAGVAYKEYATDGMGISEKAVFIENMNKMAKRIGMENTTYNNETGLDITNEISGGHGTAYDISLLYKYILKIYPDLFTATTKANLEITSLDNILHTAKNTNQNVATFSGIMGSKTGYTDLAGGNLAVVFDSGLGTPIIVVVLGSSVEGRFEDVATLSSAALEAVSQDLF